MPRRGGGGRAPSRGFSSMPASRSSVPARAPAPAPPAPVAPPMMQQKQPGMFAQMATTAAGVAVGSAVGHTIGAAMTGGMGGGGGSEVQAAPAPIQQPAYQQQAGGYQDNQQACSMEMKQFMECAQTQSDITLCQGFNEALRQCRINYGIALQ